MPKISKAEKIRRMTVVHGYSKRGHSPNEIKQIEKYLQGGKCPDQYKMIDEAIPTYKDNNR